MTNARKDYAALLLDVYNGDALTAKGRADIVENLATHLGCVQACKRLVYVVAEVNDLDLAQVAAITPPQVVALAIPKSGDPTVRHALLTQAAIVDAYFATLLKL